MDLEWRNLFTRIELVGKPEKLTETTESVETRKSGLQNPTESDKIPWVQLQLDFGPHSTAIRWCYLPPPFSSFFQQAVPFAPSRNYAYLPNESLMPGR